MASKRCRPFRLGVSGLLLLVALGACGGPVSFIPGGRLDGPTVPTNANWNGVGESGIAAIETNPADPYSVTIAYNVVGGKLYVNAGSSEKRWAKNAVDYPNVRLRIDGDIYDLRAIRVEDPAEIARFGEAWTQGWFRRDPTQFEEVWVFRLMPRETTADGKEAQPESSDPAVTQ